MNVKKRFNKLFVTYLITSYYLQNNRNYIYFIDPETITGTIKLSIVFQPRLIQTVHVLASLKSLDKMTA